MYLAPAVLLFQTAARSKQGMVVFFPSNSYAEQATEHWQRSGTLAAFEQHKRVFRCVPFMLM